MITRCRGCHHVWQTDLTVTVDYANGYAEKTYDSYDGSLTAHLRAGLVAPLMGHKPDSKVLDFGFGNGSFLRLMDAAGYATRGLDVHSDHPEIQRADLATEFFNVVTFFDSLEHVACPDAVLRSIQLRRSDPCVSCAVVISRPVVPLWFWARPRDWKHFKPGEHLHYFSMSSSLLLVKGACGSVREDRTCFIEDITRGKLQYKGRDEHNICTEVFLIG